MAKIERCTNPIIRLKGISKSFRTRKQKGKSILEIIMKGFSIAGKSSINWTLKGITLEIDPKQIVGIIGRNGSGKSTLLRIIAQIYKPTRGKIQSRGRILPLINLYIGLLPKLNIIDSIYLISSLFGIERKKAKVLIPDILEFSELKEYQHLKTHQLSEGMKQRLVFSIAIHSRPDILLLDEIFEIGDQRFKDKSAAFIRNIAADGGIVLLVSHDIEMIDRHCSHVIWIDDGRIRKQGSASEVIASYLQDSQHRKVT